MWRGGPCERTRLSRATRGRRCGAEGGGHDADRAPIPTASAGWSTLRSTRCKNCCVSTARPCPVQVMWHALTSARGRR